LLERLDGGVDVLAGWGRRRPVAHLLLLLLERPQRTFLLW
jgi:hypothetical protein